MMAVADKKMSDIHLGLKMSFVFSSLGSAREKTSAGPSANPQTTKPPTASKATSLTTASNAMAVTPRHCAVHWRLCFLCRK